MLTSVRRESGSLRVKGTISVPASGLVQLDFYESTDCVAGVGEGAQLLGTINLAVAGAGNATFDETIAADRAAGTDVTATATRDGETSEFSACAEVTEAPATTVTLTPTSRTVLEGGTADFTVHRSGDTSGSADVSWSTHPGSATAPADYAVAGGTVHFAAGDADEPISVAIADDADVESDESFTVTLDDVTNATTTTEIERSVDRHGHDPQPGRGLVRGHERRRRPRRGDRRRLRPRGRRLHAARRDPGGQRRRGPGPRHDRRRRQPITNIELGSALPAVVEPLILSGEIASGRVTIDGNDVAGLTIDAGAAQQTQVFDVNLVDAALDVIGSDALLQDADVSGAAGAGVRFGAARRARSAARPGTATGSSATAATACCSTPDRTTSTCRTTGSALDGANAGDGIRSSDPQAQVFDNTLSGNGGAGLRLLACADVVTGNRIGTQADGSGAVPNGGAGIVVAAAGCQIGAPARARATRSRATAATASSSRPPARSCSATRSAPTAAAGVRSPGAAARLRGNSITGNGGLGIDTGAAGVSGGAPQLTAVVRESGKLHVTGTLAAATAGQYDLEFIATPQCDPSGSGEGATPIAVKAILVASPGAAPFDLVLDTDLPAGTIVSATATTGGQTSEFAACATVTEPGGTPRRPAAAAPRRPAVAPRRPAAGRRHRGGRPAVDASARRAAGSRRASSSASREPRRTPRASTSP